MNQWLDCKRKKEKEHSMCRMVKTRFGEKCRGRRKMSLHTQDQDSGYPVGMECRLVCVFVFPMPEETLPFNGRERIHSHVQFLALAFAFCPMRGAVLEMV
jgi:hypothetical protein